MSSELMLVAYMEVDNSLAFVFPINNIVLLKRKKNNFRMFKHCHESLPVKNNQFVVLYATERHPHS